MKIKENRIAELLGMIFDGVYTNKTIDELEKEMINTFFCGAEEDARYYSEVYGVYFFDMNRALSLLRKSRAYKNVSYYATVFMNCYNFICECECN